jgi:hypothetical protein
MMIRLVPKVFFHRMEEGLDLFVNCLGFTVLYQDSGLAVVGRDGAKAYVVVSAEGAAQERPEIAIETDTIRDLHQSHVAAARDRVVARWLTHELAHEQAAAWLGERQAFWRS